MIHLAKVLFTMAKEKSAKWSVLDRCIALAVIVPLYHLSASVEDMNNELTLDRRANEQIVTKLQSHTERLDERTILIMGEIKAAYQMLGIQRDDIRQNVKRIDELKNRDKYN